MFLDLSHHATLNATFSLAHPRSETFLEDNNGGFKLSCFPNARFTRFKDDNEWEAHFNEVLTASASLRAFPPSEHHVLENRWISIFCCDSPREQFGGALVPIFARWGAMKLVAKRRQVHLSTPSFVDFMFSPSLPFLSKSWLTTVPFLR
jgi:hypothetical protein